MGFTVFLVIHYTFSPFQLRSFKMFLFSWVSTKLSGLEIVQHTAKCTYTIYISFNSYTTAERPQTPPDMQYSFHTWEELSEWKSGSRFEISAEVSAGTWSKKTGKLHSWSGVRMLCFVMHDVSAAWENALCCKWNRYGQETAAVWKTMWRPLYCYHRHHRHHHHYCYYYINTII